MSLNVVTIALDAYIIGMKQFFVLIVDSCPREILGHIAI